MLDHGAKGADDLETYHKVERTREAKWVKQRGACCGDLVDVEAGVDELSGTLNGRVDVAACDVAVLVWRAWKRTRRRECEVFLSVGLVTARFVQLVDGVQETLVQREQVVVEVYEWLCRN
jgi:hypothetical protein